MIMKKDYLPSLVVKADPCFTLVAVAMLAAIALVFVNPAHAAGSGAQKNRTAERSGTYHSSNGNSGTFNGTAIRSKGALQRDGSWTNRNGLIGTRSADLTWDKSTGIGTVSALTTLSSGKSQSREGTFAQNVDGSISSQGIMTGLNGNILNYAGVTTKTEGGSSTSGTFTGANGKTGSFTTEVAGNAPGDVSRSSTLTGPGGKTSERTTATTLNGDGTGTRTVEATKADGTMDTRTGTFTLTKTPAN